MTTTHFGARQSLPRGSRTRRCRGPLLGGMGLRWRVWLRERALDEELAEGADPTESDELSLRTGQLSSVESRDRLAVALERLVRLAEEQPHPPDTMPLLVRRCKVRACRTLLLDLAESVRNAGPSDVQGIAMTARLISDRTGLLYRGGSTQPLASQVFSVLFALERRVGPERDRGR